MNQLAIIVLAGISLTGCSAPHQAEVSPECGRYDREKLKNTDLAKLSDTDRTLSLAVIAAEDCAHHTAATFASGSDGADVIAASVADVCVGQIANWAGIDAAQHPASVVLANAQPSVREEVIRQAKIEVLRDRAARCPAS